LNTIAKNYPAIPKLIENEVFDSKTEASVKIFQKIAKMPQTGIIDRATWYRISDYYVAIRKLETPRPQCAVLCVPKKMS
jgi:murein L,D-transpeptidase YcbB/YkuD